MAGRKRKKQNNRGIVWLVLTSMALLIFLVVIKVGGGNRGLFRINPYREGDFALEGGYMTCLTGDSRLGIDVSYYQGRIDWAQVRQAGIEFAFVRLGYRRSGDGVLGADEMAMENLRGAAAAGVKVGAYFFSQAISEEEAREEARFALDLLGDIPLDLPLAYDWEAVDGSSRTRGMTQQTLTQCVEAFCSQVEAAGYESMVYFNQDLSRTLLNVYCLGDRPVWFAMYNTYPDAPCKPDYWQYTDQGRVPGIKGYVDLNLYLPE